MKTKRSGQGHNFKKQEVEYIRSNYKKKSDREIGEFLGVSGATVLKLRRIKGYEKTTTVQKCWDTALKKAIIAVTKYSTRQYWNCYQRNYELEKKLGVDHVEPKKIPLDF